MSEINVIWLAVIKEGQSFWIDVHHRPKRSGSDLRQYCMCCGGGRKKYKISNITEQFSFWLLPDPGGLSVPLISHSWSSLCFPCSPAGLMAPLSWASPGQRANSFSVFGDVSWAGRNKHGPPWVPTEWGAVGQNLSGAESKKVPVLPAFSHPHTALALSHILAWQWASGSPEPQHCSGITWLSQPRARQPIPVCSPAQDRHGTSFPRGELGQPNPSHPSFRASLHTRANARYVFRN